MPWLDKDEYTPDDLCTICHDTYGTSQAIYKTNCNHNFHNNCLNEYCETYSGEVVCPVCRSDIEYGCMDVWAFKEKALGNPRGEPLFNGNEHVTAIYNEQLAPQGGRRRNKRSNRKSKRRKSNRSKRRVNKKKTRKNRRQRR